jgi:hypothetical protein
MAVSTEGEAPIALLKSCESLMAFSLSDTGLKLIVRGHMPQAGIWPDLTKYPSAKIQNFVRERLPRWKQELSTEVEKLRSRLRRVK